MVKKYGLNDIIRGMASQIAEREDHIIVDDLRGETLMSSWHQLVLVCT